MIALMLACTGPTQVTQADLPALSCDPVDPSLCALPFPSSTFLTEADTETGYRVALAEDTLPVTREGVQLRPDYWNEKDGFSPSSQLLVWLGDVDTTGLISHANLGAYTEPDATTVIVNTKTGERVPHWAERDVTDYDQEEVLLLRPAVPLDFDTTYVVGIRGLSQRDGTAVPVSDAFRWLRSARYSNDDAVEVLRPRYESEIFPALAAQGIPREDLQVAWSFHTASRQSTLGRMKWMRDDMLATVGEDGPDYTITRVRDSDNCPGNAKIWRTIEGRMTVPLYTEDEDAPTLLTRDETGWPYQNGTVNVPFMIRVPCVLLEEERPGTLVQMGHGLLGVHEEVRDHYLNDLAVENGWVLFSVPWSGMTWYDRPAIISMLITDPSDFAQLPERSMQGMVGALAAMRMMRGAMAEDPLLMVGETPVIDTSTANYYGNSQGAILGAALVGMSTEIERAALGVGGSPFSLLLDRSIDFTAFLLLLDQNFSDRRETTLYVNGLVQQLWDPAEASGWLTEVDADVLMQVAIGDAEVTPLGAHIMARAYGAHTIDPETRPVWGVSPAVPPFTGSALVEWQYTDVPDAPVGPEPPATATSPHECPRRQPDAQAQVGHFIRTGEVVSACDGEICTAQMADWCLGL